MADDISAKHMATARFMVAVRIQLLHTMTGPPTLYPSANVPAAQQKAVGALAHASQHCTFLCALCMGCAFLLKQELMSPAEHGEFTCHAYGTSLLCHEQGSFCPFPSHARVASWTAVICERCICRRFRTTMVAEASCRSSRGMWDEAILKADKHTVKSPPVIPVT